MWHGFAKLQLHTESTLQSLDNSTTRLGVILRKFKSTVCEDYDTKDLPSEEAACGHCKAAATAKKPQSKKRPTPASQNKTKAHSPKKHQFNLDTYKLRSLSNYVKTIKCFGMTDNTSTQTVCVFFYSLIKIIFNMHRGNSSTIGQSNFTHVFTRESMWKEYLFTNDVNGYFTKFPAEMVKPETIEKNCAMAIRVPQPLYPLKRQRICCLLIPMCTTTCHQIQDTKLTLYDG